MSLYDYEMSKKLMMEDPPFCALIMAAMRKADTDNLERLKVGFFDTWEELQTRYNAPGGRLKGDE